MRILNPECFTQRRTAWAMIGVKPDADRVLADASQKRAQRLNGSEGAYLDSDA